MQEHDHIDDKVLYALFCMSRATLPIDVASIADSAGVSVVAAGESFVRLEQAQLINANRARLTMLGLAKAVSLKADLGGTAPVAQWRGAKQQASDKPLPIAAHGEVEDGMGR